MTFKEIQNDVIRKHNIDICDGTKCTDDWHRTHAHWKLRRVCKWKQANSVQSTFTLLHEVGHIVNHVSGDRRAESEYHATMWALQEAEKYGIEVPEKIVEEYQEYIDMEIRRGTRRGGTGYGDLSLENGMEEYRETHKTARRKAAKERALESGDFTQYAVCYVEYSKDKEDPVAERLDGHRFMLLDDAWKRLYKLQERMFFLEEDSLKYLQILSRDVHCGKYGNWIGEAIVQL